MTLRAAFGLALWAIAGSLHVEAADVIYAATSSGIFKSTNGGGDWRAASFGISGIPVFALAIDPDNPEIVYAGTFGSRVFKTTNGGGSWVPAAAAFSDDTVLTLVVDPSRPQTIYSGTTLSASGSFVPAFFPGTGLFKSSNGAGSWSAANTGLPRAVVTGVAVAPSNPAILYAGTGTSGVFKSTDGGRTWAAANAGIATSDISGLAVDPVGSDTVYAALEGCSAGCAAPAGVYKSTNGGISWTSASAGLVDDLQVVALAIDPGNPRVLYAATRFNGLFKTTDGGDHWVSINPAPTGTMLAIVHFALALDPASPGTVYAGTFDGVLKTLDGGKTWMTANNGLPAATRVFALALH